MSKFIKTPLQQLVPDYDVLFCDVWGVVHNGVSVWNAAQEALLEARKAGKYVVLLTNSPRRNSGVATQLSELGLSANAYDEIVTSGDVTRNLIKANPNKLFHLGPDRDKPLFEGLDVDFANQHDAKTVVCTGLFDDRNEGLEPYYEMIADFAARDVTFICANPDIIVHHGGKMLYCAGALAKCFEEHGKIPLVAGKPHQPIYDHAFENVKKAMRDSGKSTNGIEKSKILAIGDALPTDVKGANDYGLDVLFISGGIHREEFGELEHPSLEKMTKLLDQHGFSPKGYMPQLRW